MVQKFKYVFTLFYISLRKFFYNLVLKFRKKEEKQEYYDQHIRYPNENSPWQINQHKFQDGRWGFTVLVLRIDQGFPYHRWCNILCSTPYWCSDSKVVFDIEEPELREIIIRDFDTWINWLGLMFSTKEEAERFINEYSHHYDTTYFANILMGVL